MTVGTRVGMGFDVHRLVRGRLLILGGLEIESTVGLEGHSDGDVLLHAVTDAILGACSLGDIGDYFPSNDPRWKDADSNTFLQEALTHVEDLGYEIVNVDTVIVAERPHLGAWKEGIRSSLAGMLDVPADRVCVKAKTMEGLGAVGEGRAIEAHAVVLLQSFRDEAPKPAKAAKSVKPAKSSAKSSAKPTAKKAVKAPAKSPKSVKSRR
ncbi:MAG: 2-C-methyl-D-erythritol 2,4-cyclodiphosphate synthase [Planctomycetes bacterium]|nr:2-C-methyl-D-erythritol 2,4-cyclodiphosphate synthase [Planctomycetota bacterium]